MSTLDKTDTYEYFKKVYGYYPKYYVFSEYEQSKVEFWNSQKGAFFDKTDNEK